MTLMELTQLVNNRSSLVIVEMKGKEMRFQRPQDLELMATEEHL